MTIEPIEQKVDVLRETIVALVRRDGPDPGRDELVRLAAVVAVEAVRRIRGLAEEALADVVLELEVRVRDAARQHQVLRGLPASVHLKTHDLGLAGIADIEPEHPVEGADLQVGEIRHVERGIQFECSAEIELGTQLKAV